MGKADPTLPAPLPAPSPAEPEALLNNRPIRIGRGRRVGRALGVSVALGLGLAAGAAAPPPPPTPPRPVIRVVLDNDYPPYAFTDEHGRLQGITVDHWRLWERQTGIRAELHGMDWGEAMREMHDGKFDVIDTIFETDPRRTYLAFTPAYARLEVPIFFRQGLSGITDLASLKGFPVAAKAGDAAVDLLQHAGIAPVQLFTSYQAIIRAARERKVNLFVMDRPPAIYLLNQQGIAADFKMSGPVSVGEFHRAVAKDRPALLRQVEQGFAALAPAELRQIDEKWLGHPLADPTTLRTLGYGALGLTAVAVLFAGWSWTLARTVRRRTAELNESRALLDGVLKHSPSIIFVKDLAGRYLLANPGYQAILRAGAGTVVVGRTDADLMPPEAAAAYRRDDEAVAASGLPRVLEETVPHPDGPHPYLTVKFPLRDARGRIFAVAGIATDITDRKRTQAALDRARTDLERAQAISHVGNWEFFAADAGVKWSDELYRIFGLEPQAGPITYDRLVELIHPEDRERHEACTARMRAARPGEAIPPLEYRVQRPDGTIAHVLVTAELSFDAQGRSERWFGTAQDITERKQAEETLQLMRYGVDHADDGVFWISPAGDVLYANLSACRQLGYSQAELACLRIFDLDPDYQSDRWPGHWEALKRQGSLTFETRHRAKSGAVHPVEVNANHVRAGGREFNFAFTRDITGRKQAEAALRASEANYRSLFESASEGIVILDPQSRAVAANAACGRMLGYAREELLTLGVGDIVVADDLPRLRQTFAAAPVGAVLRGEWTCRRKDGTVFLCDVSATVLPDGRLQAIGRDVTDRKQAEQHIRKLNRTLAMLSDINQLIVREHDPAVMLTAACRIAVGKGELRMAWIGLIDGSTGRLAITAHDGTDEATLQVLRALVEGTRPDCAFTFQALQTGEHGVCNDIAHDPQTLGWREAALARGYRAVAALPLKRDGAVIGTFNLYAGEPDFFNAEEMRLVDELALDISFALEVGRREQERRRADEELRWKTAFFEAQVDSALDGILVVDQQGRKILQNRRLNELWQIPAAVAADPDDAAQIKFVSSRTKNPREFVEQIVRLYAHPDLISRDVVELVDGTVLDRSSFPVRDKSGKYFGRIWAFRDISQQRQLEEQFRQSQKMEAIGRLAGGVAHDFNNILAAIMMQAGLAAIAPDLPPEARDMLGEIQAAAERAANLTRQLLAFSSRQIMQSRLLDLNEIVTSLAKMLQRIVGEDVHLQLNLHPRPLPIWADAGMLDQVLLNLVVNSRDAMPAGGRLVIETNERDLSDGEAAAIPGAAPGRCVCLEVTDTGIGMPPENRSRIFDPFFTTKAPGKGTGLGLATVFGIVRQHGGWITVESEPGRGSTFRIFLPADDRPAEPTGPDAATHPPPGGTETILLVEDEPSVRMVTRSILERAGYTVLEADHGPAALRVWEQAVRPVDLLLTDMVMPEGMSGRDLALRLQALQPGLRVVFTSGYNAEIAGRELDLADHQSFIQKPWAPGPLLRIIRRALDA